LHVKIEHKISNNNQFLNTNRHINHK